MRWQDQVAPHLSTAWRISPLGPPRAWPSVYSGPALDPRSRILAEVAVFPVLGYVGNFKTGAFSVCRRNLLSKKIVVVTNSQ